MPEAVWFALPGCVYCMCGNICLGDIKCPHMSSRVHDHVKWLWPRLPTIHLHKTYEIYNDTHFFFPQTSVPPHSPTHTPFSFSPKTIVLVSHFHMCVGHKTAKRRLKASFSWLTGSQFVSYKHRTHLSPNSFHISFWPPYLSMCSSFHWDRIPGT